MDWADEELHPGRILGPYELLVPVGSGGMAHVWAARHRGAGVIFALKMLMPHLAENVAFRDMFFDEARVASRIRHENVARTFELVELDGVLTLVMEFVDGSSLVHLLRPGDNDGQSPTGGGSGSSADESPVVPVPFRHAVKMIGETCAGLHAAHELVDDRGQLLAVVHRDVSPHNILLTTDGKVKITDFGVAKALGKSHVTIAGQVKGKLAYMSPEQLVGGGIDRRSDVFALGSVLYETTTGVRPFLGEHDPQIMAAIIMGNCVPPSAVMRNYPPALEKIVMRALATDPDARYSTALQLRQALEGWLAASGPQLGSHQIAVLLQERCGGEIEARKSALSQFAKTTSVASARIPTPAEAMAIASLPLPLPLPRPLTPSALTPIDMEIVGGSLPNLESGTSAMEVDPRRSTVPNERGRPSSLGLIGGVLAVVIGLAGGLGVLAYVHAKRQARLDAISNTTPDASISVIATANDASVLIVGELDPPKPVPSVVATTVKPALILLRGVPEDAHIIVEGAELPAGTTSVSRPDAGAINVLIRVDGKEDAMTSIDATTPDEIDIPLKDKPAVTAPDHQPPRGGKRPKKDPSLPPNPYD